MERTTLHLSENLNFFNFQTLWGEEGGPLIATRFLNTNRQAYIYRLTLKQIYRSFVNLKEMKFSAGCSVFTYSSGSSGLKKLQVRVGTISANQCLKYYKLNEVQRTLKWTVNAILSNLSFMKWQVRFTTVP